MKTEEYKDPWPKQALILLIIAFLLVLFATFSLHAQTLAGGNVMSHKPYTAMVGMKHNGITHWVRWEEWEIYEIYNIKVNKNDTAQAVWLSQCTGDTLATAYFYGKKKKIKVYGDIKLDGSTYHIGQTLTVTEK